MTENNTCPECGAELPADAPAGVCPKCLLQVGMDESLSGGESVAASPTLTAGAMTPAKSPSSPPTECPPDRSETPPSLGANVKYFGEYELLDEIARGGMGVVYKARQTRLNRIVALKMILAGQFAGEAEVNRFHVEAEAAAKLDHPDIVPIFEVGEHEGRHYFSMGFVDGESLAARVADGPLQAREAAQLLKRVAEAVQYAHDRGVIHRDLKPANVLLQTVDCRPKTEETRTHAHSSAPDLQPTALSLQPKISDFGLAKKVEGDSGLTATGQVLGTPSYMPPEQASGRVNEAKESADIYALGAVLYATLTGRPPFQSDNPLDTLTQVLEREPISPRQLNPKVPRDLETICLKCLQKEPRRRYSTAAALADDLGRHLDHKPIQARPIGVGRRAVKWAKRRPAIAALLVVAIIGLAGVVWQWWRANHEWRRAERLLVESQTSLYTNQIHLADRERLDGRLERMEEILDTCPPALRHWEWRYLKRQSHPELLCIEPDTSVFDLAVSPDSQTIAVSGSFRRRYGVAIYDAQTGEQIHRLRGHEFPVRALAFSPSGKWLIAGGGRWRGEEKESEVKLWNLETQEESLSFDGHGDLVAAAAFHPDGDKVATGDRSGVVRLWSVETGEQLDSLQAGSLQINGVAFDPRGDRLAIASGNISGSGGSAAVFDLKAGQKRTTLEGTSGSVYDIEFSRHGRWIAAGDIQNKVLVWDSVTGEAKHTLHDAGRKVAFSPDGKFLATADAWTPQRVKATKVWDLKTGRLIRTYFDGFNCLAFFPDGSRIVTAGLKGSFKDTVRVWTGMVKVWDATQEPDSVTLPVDAGPFDAQAMAFSPDGRQIIIGDDSTVLTETNENGTTTGNRKAITLWDVATREKIWHAVIEDRDHTIRDLAFGPDGKWFATVQSWNGRETDPTCKVTVWDAEHGKPTWRIQRPPTDRLWSLAISRDGQRLAFGGHSQTVEVCDTKTGQQVLTIPIEARILALSPDGRWLAAPSSVGAAEVTLFETSTGKQWRALGVELPEIGSINDLAFSPDGRYLAAAHGFHTREDAVTLWEVPSGTVKALLRGHSDDVTCVAFSPDSRRLVSGGSDEGIIVWHVELGQPVMTFPSRVGEVSSVAFSPDGTRIAALGRGGARVWDGTPMASDKKP